jgi:hypothetical protein
MDNRWLKYLGLCESIIKADMPSAAPLLFVVRPSTRAGKKWMAEGSSRSGRRVCVHFGALGYSDYPQHKDTERRDRYIRRHAVTGRETWGMAGLGTAGFWSRWLLWNKPSMRASADDMRRRFGISVRLTNVRA